MVGFVQDCNGFPPRQSGTLCGARAAYTRALPVGGRHAGGRRDRGGRIPARHAHGRGQRLRPHAPQGGRRGVGARLGRVRSGHRAASRPWLRPSRSWTSARTACGEKTHSGGTSRSPESWRRRETASRDGRSVGRLCGARALAVVGELAYVAAEMSNALSVMTLPGLTVKNGSSNAGQDVPISAATPGFRGTVVDERLEGAYAVAVDSVSRFRTAYVASRFCRLRGFSGRVGSRRAGDRRAFTQTGFPRARAQSARHGGNRGGRDERKRRPPARRRVRRARRRRRAATTKKRSARSRSSPPESTEESRRWRRVRARQRRAGRVRAVLRRGREARAVRRGLAAGRGYSTGRTPGPTPSGNGRLLYVGGCF